jgi:predicted ATP-binding protein involved in virulence
MMAIATINKIDIKNFFSISNIEIDNLKDKKEIYIVGENGDGKTLFLQSILVGLAGIKKGEVFELYECNPHDNLLLLIEMDNNLSYSDFSIKAYSDILAYGASRNNYCQLKEDSTGYLTLFSGEYDLRSPIEWLIELYNAKNANEKTILSLDKAIKLLQYLLNKDIEIEVTYKTIIFKEKNSEVSFDQLSAGYKGVITIICDLIARLSEKQQVENISDFQGVVLIDEVELHLHPKWQYGFMQKLRTTFPLIQFIVTTHSPTVLLGAGMEAVYYQIYKEEGVVKISEQRDIKNDFLNDIQSDIFGFDVNDERINNPSEDDKKRQKRAKDAMLSLIETIEKGE